MQEGMNGSNNDQKLGQDDKSQDKSQEIVKKTLLDTFRHKMGLVGVGVLVLVAAVITSTYSVYWWTMNK